MKILTAFFKNDYGDPKRGLSAEHLIWVPAFQEAGFETIPFYFEDNGYPYDRPGLQNRLLKQVKTHRPDFVFFILMTEEVSFATLDEINSISRTVNWFCDDQWRFEDFSSKVAPHLTECLTVDKYCIQKYKDLGFNHVHLVHWFPPFNIEEVNVEEVNYEYDVSFVGGKNLIREWVVTELNNAGIPVACFGQGWSNGKISFERMREIFLRSKINLNLSNSVPTDRSFYEYSRNQQLANARKIFYSSRNPIRKWHSLHDILDIKAGRKDPFSAKNQEQVKARNFEIAGCGGFQLSKMAIGLEDFYQIGKELMIYNTIDELKQLIHYYLNNEKERKIMARNAFEKTKGYQLKNHLKEIFEWIK